MSHASDYAFPFVSRTVNGAEVRFGKLTPRDRQGILDRLKRERRESRKANAKDAGLPPEQVYAELEVLDEQPFGEERWIGYVNTPAGREEIVRLAFAKCNKDSDATATIDAMEVSESDGLLQIVCDLCNLRRTTDAKPADGEKKAGDEENPIQEGTGKGYGS